MVNYLWLLPGGEDAGDMHHTWVCAALKIACKLGLEVSTFSQQAVCQALAHTVNRVVSIMVKCLLHMAEIVHDSCPADQHDTIQGAILQAM